jgi:hypothetical protein
MPPLPPTNYHPSTDEQVRQILDLMKRQSNTVYPDLWIDPLIGMPTDTLVTSTQHLDAMEAHSSPQQCPIQEDHQRDTRSSLQRSHPRRFRFY